MVELELVAVRVELPSNTPAVVLRELEGPGRILSIFIGGPEAAAIAFAMEGVATPRPLTHDLLVDVTTAMGFTLERVDITELRDTTFYAELHFAAEGETRVVSSRPSDALALSVRVGCPIFCSEEVMEEAGFFEETDSDGPDPEQSEAMVEEFKQFIDRISPEDFES